jgi:general stress protein 26
MKELDFNELSNEIIEKLEKEQNIVFATSANNIVSARTMCHVNIGLDILFSTGGKSGKVEQIKQNANVALVIGDLQIEAKAELFGHPSKHQRFIEKNDIKFPWMKDAFKPEPGKEDDGMLIICHPTKITIYKYLEGNPHWDVLSMENKKAVRL